MAKMKLKNKNKNVLKKDEDKKPRKDPRVEEIYEEEITFTCPVRGLVKQKVKVKRFKTFGEQTKHLLSTSDAIDKLEEADDGLAMYSDGEDNPEINE